MNFHSLDLLIANVAAANANTNGITALAGGGVRGSRLRRRTLSLKSVFQSLGESSSSLGRI